jgi:hypothetical protein
MSEWDTARVRLHSLNAKAFSGDNEWKATEFQVFQLFEIDFIFQCRAFKHVVPATPLDAAQSKMYMTEKWRRHGIDLGHFKCMHCRQFAKNQFCSEVRHAYLYCTHLRQAFNPVFSASTPKCVSVMVAENVLTEQNIPNAFRTSGVETNIDRRCVSTRSNVYGVNQELSTPEKAQRFSSQSRKKR